MVQEKFKGNPINGVYAVADGHAGFHAAQFCSVNLTKTMEQFVNVDEKVSWKDQQLQLTQQFTQGKSSGSIEPFYFIRRARILS